MKHYIISLSLFLFASSSVWGQFDEPGKILTAQESRAADYCVWDEDAFPRAGTNRVVRSLTIEGAYSEEQTVKFTTTIAGAEAETQSNIYFDNTDDILYATVGNELVINVDIHNLAWMHFFAFIDYNQDGVFDADEVVSYTHFQPQGGSYQNSKGESVTNSVVATTMPSFTIPATANLGETRMRFISGWNSLDPCGTNLGGGESVNGTMCDFTICIEEAPTSISTVNQDESVVSVKNGILTVKGVKADSEVIVYNSMGQKINYFLVNNTVETFTLSSKSLFYLIEVRNGADSIVKKVIDR
ncbi:T9SS type A sorting domain-containing protein [Bacteroides nordii]|uniref:T9SS type A sorting domain-containing protein n=1 Tax=Bacteroides nordii TaxID=291645 RepID=UPI001F29F59D|nr:T9SS type A sorting domain-containing protein [Bacteroides nordii]MCE8464151.1 T9SS type A sorting domain-containing protein [Bacteroides nordii]UYU49600.1 T9SS type A sorting domain-containing protein [Bacteroides nordii]